MGQFIVTKIRFLRCLAREFDFNMALFVLLGLLALSSASYANKIQPYCYALQEEPTKLPPPVFMCSKCRAKAWMYWTWDPTTFIPLCNPKDDSWAAKQCSKGKCWCVDKYGKKIKASTRPKAKPLNCKKIRADTKKKTRRACPNASKRPPSQARTSNHSVMRRAISSP